MKFKPSLLLLLGITGGGALHLSAQNYPSSDINLVIYDRGAAFVTEKRKVSFDIGTQSMIVNQLPGTLQENTLYLDGAFQVISLESAGSTTFWLNDLIGKEIVVTGQEASIVGTLRRVSGSSLFLETGKGVVFIPDYMQYRLEFANLSPVANSPGQVKLRYSGAKKGEGELQLSYQLPGVNWNVSYEALMNEKTNVLDITAWAEITNHSGHDFGLVNVRLLAGQVNRKNSGRSQAGQPEMFAMSMRAKAADSDIVSDENAVSEYYSFDISEKFELSSQRLRKLVMFQAPEAKIEKTYIFHAYPAENELKPVPFVLILTNKKESGLGRVLPAGTMRVYAADGKFKTLAGEAGVKNVPEGESQEIALGAAQDVLAAHWMSESRQNGPKVRDESFDYRLKNRKQETVKMILRKDAGTNWQIMKSDVTWNKVRQDQIQTEISLKPGEEKTIKLQLRYTYE